MAPEREGSGRFFAGEGDEEYEYHHNGDADTGGDGLFGSNRRL